MPYRVVIYDRNDSAQRSELYSDENVARVEFDRPLSGRFVRSELWSGAVSDGVWKSDKKLDSKNTG